MTPFTPEHTVGMRAMIKALAGDVDATGVELRSAIRILANQYDAIEDEALRQAGLSGPRWTLLMRLIGEEELRGNTDVSPTYLSRCLRVSKNTVSSLLNGLEEQGLVERVLDSEDKRSFHIHLTPEGRATVKQTAPEHLVFLNRVVSRLSPDERKQLASLLAKLYSGLTEETESRLMASAVAASDKTPASG
jgi:DNA-binding MarR family transcriptional regulator